MTFACIDGELCAERVPLSAIAQRYGTPSYVYSRAMLADAFAEYDAAFAGLPHLVCYAMKANPSLAILDLFASLGSGFDIVSGGELLRVKAAGGDTRKVVFSGVGKSDAEMEAALAAGILCFNVESASELDHLAAVAMLAACGVKGPLRPPPKSTPAARAPTENPATPPATTSPALPPPSIPAAKPVR